MKITFHSSLLIADKLVQNLQFASAEKVSSVFNLSFYYQGFMYITYDNCEQLVINDSVPIFFFLVYYFNY